MAKIHKPPTIKRFTSTLNYTFTVTAASATIGATYTNNGQTFTVLYTVSSGTTLVCSGTGAPAASGTLTKSTGTGDATITFSSNVATGQYQLPSMVSYIQIKMIGGGAGGAGSGTGAGGGNSGAGGTTTFGTSLLSASGGFAAAPNSTGGPGGDTLVINSPAVAIVSMKGSDGLTQSVSASTTNNSGGHGGTSPFGGSGYGGYSGNAPRNGVTNSGSGGGGAGGSSAGPTQAGCGGGAGAYLEAIITNPSSTYTFTIGAGGTAGSAGTSGVAGAIGGSGVIEVTEYY